VGAVQVGDHVAIGANCVVTDDVPDYAVVVGIPGRVISFDGSVGYVNRTDYPGGQQAAGQSAASSARGPSEDVREMVSASAMRRAGVRSAMGAESTIREEQDRAGIRHCAP
jgi:hypothetical protein